MLHDRRQHLDDRDDVDGDDFAEERHVFVFSREAVQRVDAEAVRTFAMPGIVLMENAARHLATAAADLLEEIEGERVLILAGPGNNGGDGFATARHLSNAGYETIVALTHTPDACKGDAAVNLAIIERMRLAILQIDAENVAGSLAELPQPDLIIDALLGTGLDRELQAPIKEVVAWINSQRQAGVDRPAVVAADIPTGLDCNTGKVLGDAVIADLTVTFAGLKEGFLELEAQKYLGEVLIADIGVPLELLEAFGEEVVLADRHDHEADAEVQSPQPRRPHDHHDE